MSNNPFDDLAKVFGAMDAMTSRSSKQQELSRRLRRAERMNEMAAQLLEFGPKGFGGPENWMVARNKWLEEFKSTPK
jgi:hypothetical protein